MNVISDIIGVQAHWRFSVLSL